MVERPTAEALQQLRDTLPLWSEQKLLPTGWQDYCRYYSIDFSDRFAQADYRAGAVESGPYRLAVNRWQLPGATRNLVLLHGYTDHSGLFGHLIAYGLATNCNVLIFDLPGHGLSTGEPAAIDTFSEYAVALADILQAVALPRLPTWTMAQSTGCAVLMEYARHYDWPFQATVLLAPLLRPAGWQKLRLARWLLKPFVPGIPRTFNRNSSDQAFLDFIRQDPLQPSRFPLKWIEALRDWLAALPLADLGVGPALVLQGDQDGTVDWRYNTRQIDKLFPGSDIHYLQGAGHQLANESLAHRGLYLPYIDAYLKERVPLTTDGL